ncbi:hypothetical protein HMPREF1557_00546 [Streptococcus sobrinus W1703]|uniref:Uncharacterized protein n=1 Tax=Streptococcus sobrinus W1703 TaxID=1227275 RepID=U2KKV7_9STRE|nr:hypothetical protein HMPREF1557_00546 [Streptococcus sobrinus W1703]
MLTYLYSNRLIDLLTGQREVPIGFLFISDLGFLKIIQESEEKQKIIK